MTGRLTHSARKNRTRATDARNTDATDRIKDHTMRESRAGAIACTDFVTVSTNGEPCIGFMEPLEASRGLCVVLADGYTGCSSTVLRRPAAGYPPHRLWAMVVSGGSSLEQIGVENGARPQATPPDRSAHRFRGGCLRLRDAPSPSLGNQEEQSAPTDSTR